MTATPKSMARQITVAREARAEQQRVARVAPQTRLAYTSYTGQVKAPERVETWDDYCFVCSRCTDHSGEHFDRVEVLDARTDEFLSKDGKYLFVNHTSYLRAGEGPITEEDQKQVDFYAEFFKKPL